MKEKSGSWKQLQLTTALNDYSIVVQEYFHIKTEEFLNLIGKEVFQMDYFWGSFEFAKSRGWVHLHLLGIWIIFTSGDKTNKFLYLENG